MTIKKDAAALTAATNETHQDINKNAPLLATSAPDPMPVNIRIPLPEEVKHPMLAALSEFRQFIVYARTPRAGHKSKMDKIPINPDQFPLDNYHDPENFPSISAHSPQNWMTIDEAIEKIKVLSFLYSDIFGVGFSLTKTDSFVCIDLDNCINPDGSITKDAETILARFPGAGVEVSVSGKGLHIWFRSNAPLPATRKKPGIEVYTSRQFIALTGNSAYGDAGTYLTEELSAFLIDYFPASKDDDNNEASKIISESWDKQVSLGAYPDYKTTDDNCTLIERMLNSKITAVQAFGDKASVRDLLEGVTEKLIRAYHSDTSLCGYDESRADFALARHFAFWTGKDCIRIEQLMRDSVLYRDKYNKGDYLRRTILNAIETQPCILGQQIPPPPTETYAQTDPVIEWEIVSIGDTHTNPPKPPEFLIQSWLPKGELALLAGDGGTGKSQLALQVAVCVAMGLPFLGKWTIKSRVIFFSGEDKKEIIRHRIDKIYRQMNINPETVAENLMIIDATSDPCLYEEKDRKLAVTANYEKLRRHIKSFDADLVIIDNASETFYGNEIIRAHVCGFLRKIKQLKDNITVLMLAHVNKQTATTTTRKSQNNFSGSTGWNNTSRSRWFLDKNANQLTLHHEKSNHGELAPSIPLKRSPEGILIPDLADPLQNQAQDKAALIGLLTLIDKLYKQGDFISPARSTRQTAFKTLKIGSSFPSSITDAAQMQSFLESAENNGLLTREDYKNDDSKKRKRWKLLEKGFDTLNAITSPIVK